MRPTVKVPRRREKCNAFIILGTWPSLHIRRFIYDWGLSRRFYFMDCVLSGAAPPSAANFIDYFVYFETAHTVPILLCAMKANTSSRQLLLVRLSSF